jgi:uncharacterized membrane protein
MRTPGRFLGHTIHPMLVSFPIGLFVLSLVFDLVAMRGSTLLGAASFWSILGGIAGGLFAAVFGLLDWTSIPSGTRAKRIGLWHGAINVIVVTLFAIAWLLRLGTPGHEPSWMTLGIGFAAVGLLLVAGWLGGELVDRLGVGVDDDANVDAASSLAHSRHSIDDARPSRV